MDDLACNRPEELKTRFREDKSSLYIMRSHFIGPLQSCDVGINKPLKYRLKSRVFALKCSTHVALLNGEKMGIPKCIDIHRSLRQICDEFLVNVLQNSFEDCRQIFEFGVDHGMRTESGRKLKSETT